VTLLKKIQMEKTYI